MTRTYNWGILAPGNIASKFVAELQGIQSAKVLAVGSRDLIRAKEFAATWQIERCYGSYEELVADPDIDIVYIASPHAFHATHTKLCLKHKKAVLCEKAFALNLSDVSEMIETARQERVFLMEAFMTPHQPSYREARKILDSGLMGEIKHLNGWFGFNKSPYDSNGRLFNPALGGGAMLDIGLYPLFDALWFLGQPLKVEAFSDLTPQKIDQSVSVSMQFDGGKTAALFASFLAAVGVGTDIFCEKGALRLRRSSALNQSLEILLPGEDIRTLQWNETSCGLKLEAMEVMNCLNENRLESTIMSHQNSIQLSENLDLVLKKAGINYFL
ncbi:MAG: Gfo/Idh/MocA family oxidoreductase [Prolixibacteraceae bacterium]|jgi:predicted dehydrogenase|nr:Gfo/Idh/MocA family oxidoreductase [Prolixibacteraceae bacterium]